MWLMLIFDLPVGCREQVRAYSRFRKRLLAMGFQRVQKSAYLMFCGGRDRLEAQHGEIVSHLPSEGQVCIQALSPSSLQDMFRYSDGAIQPPLQEPEAALIF